MDGTARGDTRLDETTGEPVRVRVCYTYSQALHHTLSSSRWSYKTTLQAGRNRSSG